MRQTIINFMVAMLLSLGAYAQGTGSVRADQLDSITQFNDDMYIWIYNPNTSPQSHRFTFWRLRQEFQARNNNLIGLSGVSSNGFLSRTGASSASSRTLTGTTDRLTITNGNGVSGDPVFDISANYAGQLTINTLGTVTTGTWNAAVITDSYIDKTGNWTGTLDGMEGSEFQSYSAALDTYTSISPGSNVQSFLGSGSYFDLSAGDSIDVGNNKLTNLADPVNPKDAANKSWVQSQIGGAGGISGSGTPVDNQFAVFTDANTIEGTSSVIFDGANITMASSSNGDVFLSPDGTGNVRIINGGHLQMENSIAISTSKAGFLNELDVDNVKIDGNTISTTNTDGPLTLSPNGTGDVAIGFLRFDGSDITTSSGSLNLDSNFGLVEVQNDFDVLGDATVGSNSSSGTSFGINSLTSNNRNINFQTQSSGRWTIRVNGDTESGSDAGSNFEIIRRDDSGNVLGTALTINRGTGAISFSGAGHSYGAGTFTRSSNSPVAINRTTSGGIVLELQNDGSNDIEIVANGSTPRIRSTSGRNLQLGADGNNNDIVIETDHDVTISNGDLYVNNMSATTGSDLVYNTSSDQVGFTISDIREKQIISNGEVVFYDSVFVKDVAKNLIMYTLKEGTEDRPTQGYSAQWFYENYPEFNGIIYPEGWHPSEGDLRAGISNGQFVAPLYKAMEQMMNKIDELEDRIQELENQ